jgi:hypothetical protein
MKKINQLMQEIIRLTSNIETNYPELYRYLDETPLSLGNATSKEISTTDLENYLNTLKEQLHEHIVTHNKKVSGK